MSNGSTDTSNIMSTPLLRATVGVGYAEGNIPKDFPMNFDMEIRKDHLTRGLVATMRAYLIKGVHQRKNKIALTTYASWWQHFKQTYFPAWLLKRFPVRYTEKPFTYESETRICPHGDFAWGDQSHIDFLSYGDAHREGDVTLSAEWWTKFNDRMLAFDPKFWGEDLSFRVFNVIDRAAKAEKKVDQLQIELEANRKATKMWYDAAHEKKEN